MQRDFQISSGTIRVLDYGSNMDIYFCKNGNDDEFDNHFVIYSDSCHDFTTKENIEFLLDDDEWVVTLTEEDKKKIAEEVYYWFYSCSSDIHESEVR